MPEDGAARPERAQLTITQRASKAPRNTRGYETIGLVQVVSSGNYRTIAKKLVMVTIAKQ
ncbi:MAG TPA: hypothetical protein VIG72_04225 [Pontibacter sp.]